MLLFGPPRLFLDPSSCFASKKRNASVWPPTAVFGPLLLLCQQEKKCFCLAPHGCFWTPPLALPARKEMLLFGPPRLFLDPSSCFASKKRNASVWPPTAVL